MELCVVESQFEVGLRGRIRPTDELTRTVRGGFGAALRANSCVEPIRKCSECALSSRCAYGYLFETPVPDGASVMRKYPNAPHPLVLRAVPPGRSGATTDVIGLHFTLVGRAITYYPSVAFAVMALGRTGIGPERVQYAIRSVTDASDGRRLDRGDGVKTLDLPRLQRLPIALGESDGRTVNVRIETPLRLVRDGRPTQQLTAAVLVSASLRRLELLWRVHQAAPDEEWAIDSRAAVESAKTVAVIRDATRWQDSGRYSRRQGQSHPTGGLVGELVLGPGAARFLPILKLAGRLHIGKHATFGHGRFDADWG